MISFSFILKSLVYFPELFLKERMAYTKHLLSTKKKKNVIDYILTR